MRSMGTGVTLALGRVKICKKKKKQVPEAGGCATGDGGERGDRGDRGHRGHRADWVSSFKT